MNNRERVDAIMHYRPCDRIPVVAFGYWGETLEKWYHEGHITKEEASGWGDNNENDYKIMGRLGFDFNWNGGIGGNSYLKPSFEYETIRTEPDGSIISRNDEGLIIRTKPGVTSIPAHAGTSLTGREAWQALYVPKLTYADDRVDLEQVRREHTRITNMGLPRYLHIGSLYGHIRSMVGVEDLAYLAVDDEDLYVDIINTVGELCYKVTERVLSTGLPFEYAHYWEDICFKTGPLVRPSVFREFVGPWYRKISDLLLKYGVDIVSVDCDGKIDELIPVWLDNGVNTMFPIEVGTWHASFDRWRIQYGKALRGVGGMDKRVFALDRKAVDAEIERLKPIVEMGGYIPCPDHRIAPDAIWENVQYYCERFRRVFG